MPFGCFLLLINSNAEIERQGRFFEEGSPTVELGKNELLKIRMAHSDKSIVLTVLPNYQIYSYKKEFKENKILYQLIGGCFLNKDENSGAFKDAMISYTDEMYEKRTLTNEELTPLISEAYGKYFQRTQITIDRTAIEQSLSDRVKQLNSKGKFDEANSLLDKMKKIPNKLFNAYEAGERLIKIEEYDRAEREFDIAQRYAADLGEKDLEKLLKTKMQLAKKIPTLLKRLDVFLEKALNSLRNDRFDEAQKNFKAVADIYEELMDSRKAEEFGAKAKALAEYIMIEKKYRK